MCSIFCVNRQAEWLRFGAGEQHRGASVLAGVTPRVFPRPARHWNAARRFPGGRLTVSLIKFLGARYETLREPPFVSNSILLTAFLFLFLRKRRRTWYRIPASRPQAQNKARRSSPALSCALLSDAASYVAQVALSAFHAAPAIRSCGEIVETGKYESASANAVVVNPVRLAYSLVTRRASRPTARGVSSLI